jgi:membrane protease YdiL (CAAX protease family)
MPLPKNLAPAAFGPLAYLVLCALLAAAAAYPIFVFSGSDSDRFFRVLISRGAQVFLILGLVPVARWLRLGWADLGFRRAFPRQWGLGFALGGMMLGLHVLGLAALDIRGFRDDVVPARLAAILGKALATGVIVALLEELIFRGVLFAAVRKVSGPAAAVLISAAYYAGLHFLQSRWTGNPAEIGWTTGLRIVADGFAHLAAMPPDSFLALFAAGLLLGLVRAAVPRSLGLCMGLHAGWVFVIKAAKPLTYTNPEARWSFLVGSYDHIIGYLSAGWLSVLILLGLAGIWYSAGRRRGVSR